MDDLSKYCDESGLPGAVDPSYGTWDGGDTAAILGTLWFFGQMHDHGLSFSDQAPTRHPDVTKWYGQSDRFSRDQLIAVLCGLTLAKLFMFGGFSVAALYRAHKRRCFLTAWNTRKNGAMDAPKKFPDITGPEIWALWLRLLKPAWARLVLPILDLETLASAIHWRLGRKDRVTRNHMLVLLTARKHLPTFVTRLADYITDWEDLINRWDAHCQAVGEYPTADLFRREVGK